MSSSSLGFAVDAESNAILDKVIESRRSIRRFKEEIPPRELVEQILQAGLLAPYVLPAVSREDFRRFIVIPRESKASDQIALILKRKAASIKRELEEQSKTDNWVRRHAGRYLELLEKWSQSGVPNVGKAPYYIIVAEQAGIPRIEQYSLAHCLQNMWLKATALGLGFQLVSTTEELEKEKEFFDIVKIPMGEFALNGCVLGYPDASPGLPKRTHLSQITEWIS